MSNGSIQSHGLDRAMAAAEAVTLGARILRQGHAWDALTERSRRLLLVEFARALRDAWEVRARQALGNYGPDPNAERFPAWERPQSVPAVDSGGAATSSPPAMVTLSGLVDDWWKENEKLGKAKELEVLEV